MAIVYLVRAPVSIHLRVEISRKCFRRFHYGLDEIK